LLPRSGGAVISRVYALNLAWKNSQATTASAVVIATVLGAASIALPAGISLQAMLSVLFYSKGEREGEARCRPRAIDPERLFGGCKSSSWDLSK
jgi:hypothetical protein